MVYCQEPLERLKLINNINKNISDKKNYSTLKGFPLSNLIQRLRQTGNHKEQELCSKFLLKVNQPIIDRIYTWMNEGKLDEDAKDFFINLTKKDALWSPKYNIQMDTTPLFLSFDLVYKILITGRSIEFIKLQLDEDVTNDMEKIDISATLNPLSDRRLTNWINKAYFNSTKKLLQVLYNKFKFLEHMKFIKDTMLLCKGEFAYSLIEQAEDELDKLHNQVFHHRLSSCLDLAIKNSNLKFADLEFVERLRV